MEQYYGMALGLVAGLATCVALTLVLPGAPPLAVAAGSSVIGFICGRISCALDRRMP